MVDPDSMLTIGSSFFPHYERSVDHAKVTPSPKSLLKIFGLGPPLKKIRIFVLNRFDCLRKLVIQIVSIMVRTPHLLVIDRATKNQIRQRANG